MRGLITEIGRAADRSCQRNHWTKMQQQKRGSQEQNKILSGIATCACVDRINVAVPVTTRASARSIWERRSEESCGGGLLSSQVWPVVQHRQWPLRTTMHGWVLTERFACAVRRRPSAVRGHLSAPLCTQKNVGEVKKELNNVKWLRIILAAQIDRTRSVCLRHGSIK